MIFKGKKSQLVEKYFQDNNFMITSKMLMRKFNISYSNVRDVLRTLKISGIIKRQNIGRKIYYKKVE